MNLTIFANSTLYTPMSDEVTTLRKGSSLDYLREKYSINGEGSWINGLTIITVKNTLFNHLRERNRDNWIILNVGSVECYSHPSKNMLYWGMHYLNFYGCDSLFSSYVLPKMLDASKDINQENNQYYQILTANEFSVIFDLVLKLLEGFSVIMIGINNPNINNKRIDAHWIKQAQEYDNTIRDVVSHYNNISYIDCWNNYFDYVVDTTHLTPEGHLKIFEEIQIIIEKGN